MYKILCTVEGNVLYLLNAENGVLLRKRVARIKDLMSWIVKGSFTSGKVCLFVWHPTRTVGSRKEIIVTKQEQFHFAYIRVE